MRHERPLPAPATRYFTSHPADRWIAAVGRWIAIGWISDSAHLAESHVLAILMLTAAGSLVATLLDSRHWRRLCDL